MPDGNRVEVGDAEEDLAELLCRGILPEAAAVVAEMLRARGLNAGEDAHGRYGLTRFALTSPSYFFQSRSRALIRKDLANAAGKQSVIHASVSAVSRPTHGQDRTQAIGARDIDIRVMAETAYRGRRDSECVAVPIVTST